MKVHSTSLQNIVAQYNRIPKFRPKTEPDFRILANNTTPHLKFILQQNHCRITKVDLQGRIVTLDKSSFTAVIKAVILPLHMVRTLSVRLYMITPSPKITHGPKRPQVLKSTHKLPAFKARPQSLPTFKRVPLPPRPRITTSTLCAYYTK